MLVKKFLKVTAVALPLLMIIGCGGGDDTTSQTPKLSSFWSELDTKGCTSCHSTTSENSDGPDMSTPSLFVKNLVGKSLENYPNWDVSADCSAQFIKAGDAKNSMLLATLVQEDSDVMEQNNGCVSGYNYHATVNATIDKNSALYNDLVAWIDAGAQDN